jgi:uncharacterized repeat protein (TIGR03803 family)
MQGKKCSTTQGVLRRKVLGYGRQGVALTIVVVALTLASNRTNSQTGSEPDTTTAGETPALHMVGGADSQLDGEPDRAGAYKILHLFTVAKNPVGNLVFDAAGNLYGTTAAGGAHGYGAVFKLTPNPGRTWKVSILHAFRGSPDGATPQAGLTFDTAGNLYGTTAAGGTSSAALCAPYGCGVVFKLAVNPDGTWTESVLHSFKDSPDGATPAAGLVFGAGATLYGTTFYGGLMGSETGVFGGGVVFKLTPNPDGTWTESVVYSFEGQPDGANPAGGLVLDATGDLYGTTVGGGSFCSGGCGTVFKLALNPDGIWTESVLHNFRLGAGGYNPLAGLILAGGNLYGTTQYGGPTPCTTEFQSCGVVFRLAPNPDGTWTESVLHSFRGSPDGAIPQAGLMMDPAGNLYGTTFYGGVGGGVVFKLKPSSSGWKETVLHTFIGFGANPSAPVIFDPAGNLYGTTSDGNHFYNYGLVFEIMR